MIHGLFKKMFENGEVLRVQEIQGALNPNQPRYFSRYFVQIALTLVLPKAAVPSERKDQQGSATTGEGTYCDLNLIGLAEASAESDFRGDVTCQTNSENGVRTEVNNA